MKNDDFPKGRRGVALVRVSDPRKQDSASQKAVIQRWLDHHGLSVMCWIEDAGSRDLSAKREPFQRLMRMVEAEECDWVVSAEADRYGAKNAAEWGHFCWIAQQHDVEFWATDYGLLSGDDIAGEVLGTVTRSRSREEQISKATRSIRGQAEKARQGLGLGGLPPFGYDTGCFRDGVERWRVFYTSPTTRVKLWPSGQREEYNGVRNKPRKDEHDDWMIVPSIDSQRLEAVKLLFKWFASERVSANSLAKRLNDLNYPYMGGPWYGQQVLSILANPVYHLGVQVWNRVGKSRFRELIDGQTQEVPHTKGKAHGHRERQPDQWVKAEVTRQGVIDDATWDLVAAKLAAPRRSRSPKNNLLWLSGLCYCGTCGKPMAGWTRGKSLQLCCSSYRRVGKAGPCGVHSVWHTKVEEMLQTYLDTSKQKLDLLLEQPCSDSLLRALQLDSWGKARDYLMSVEGMRRFVAAYHGETEIEVDGMLFDVIDVRKAYRPLYEQQLDSTRQAINEKQELLQGLARNLGKLKSVIAIEAAETEITSLGEEIAALQQQLVPLDEKANELTRQLQDGQERIKSALHSLRGDDARKKAEALSRAVARIVLHFTNGKLEAATFEPLLGESHTVRDGNPPSMAFVADILRQTIAA